MSHQQRVQAPLLPQSMVQWQFATVRRTDQILFERRPALPVWQLPECAPPQPREPAGSLPPGALDPQLRAWLAESEAQFGELATALRAWHEERVRMLEAAASAARSTLWWPFTQHTSVRCLWTLTHTVRLQLPHFNI